MSSIRVIAGDLKGRKIPFAVSKFNNADITPQKIKGAIFSIIGETLTGSSFLDLYACSGQIGIEALSRGASPVIINEPDAKRFNFIRTYLADIEKKQEVILLNYLAERALGYLQKKNSELNFIFLDPPYAKQSENPKLYSELLLVIATRNNLAEDGTVIIQHYHKNRLEARVGTLYLTDVKEYGTSALSIYKRA